jgi:Zn-dependent peptidase ImmA (M78 family)
MSIRTARYHGEALAETCGFTGPPVDVEYVARHLRLNVAYADLGLDVSGLLISRGGVAAIAIQAKDPKNRQRFTMAHEIAHHYLRHQFEPGEHVHVDHGHAITPRNSKSSAGVDLKEIEANQFAACLLMPSKLLQARIRSLRVPSLLDSHVTLLASEFGVSEQAMTIRLSTLGYL